LSGAARGSTQSAVPQIFPIWADSALRIALAGVGLSIPGVFVVPLVYVRTPYHLDRQFPVNQPVQFDHRHHVEDDGIPCLYCHDLAERSPFAGVPATEVCMGCHSQIWNGSPMLEPVRRSFFSGQPLPWNRVHRVPDFVYFNHAVHVNGGVACAACHGDVAAMPLPRQVNLLTMGWCLDCHRQQPARYGRAPALATVAPARLPGGARHEVGTPVEPVPQLETCTACHR
jgi:hypothetical protein